MAVYLVLDGLMLVHWKKASIDVLIPGTNAHDFGIRFGGADASGLQPGELQVSMDPERPKNGPDPSPWFAQSHFCIDGMVVKRNPAASPYAWICDLPKPTELYGADRFVTSRDLLLNGEDPNTVLSQVPFAMFFCERIVLGYEAEFITAGKVTAKRGEYILINATDKVNAEHESRHGMDSFNDLLQVKDLKGGSKSTQYKVTGLKQNQALRVLDDKLPIVITEIIYRTIDAGCPGIFLVGE